MKTKLGLRVWLLLMIVVSLAACSLISGADNENLEDSSEGPQEEYEGSGFEDVNFTFSMTADLGELLADAAQDSMETEWTGTFTIDGNGLIHGSGSAFLNDAIFSEVDSCGYVWYEHADFEFTLTGEAQQRADSTTLSLVVDLASDPVPTRTAPTATCTDPSGPDPDQTPEIYFDLHRDTMLSTIYLGVGRLGPRIQIGQPLEAETGGVAYSIQVDMPVEPLTD